jgi:hypothetical protein
MNNEDDKLQIAYDRIFDLTAKMILEENYNSQLVAATLMAHALKMYKSILSEEDFKKMLQTIVESSDNILNYNNMRTIN